MAKTLEMEMIIESEVENLFGDIIREQSQGIGSSDTNACIRNIASRFKDINVECDWWEIKSKVNEEINKIEGNI